MVDVSKAHERYYATCKYTKVVYKHTGILNTIEQIAAEDEKTLHYSWDTVDFILKYLGFDFWGREKFSDWYSGNTESSGIKPSEYSLDMEELKTELAWLGKKVVRRTIVKYVGETETEPESASKYAYSALADGSEFTVGKLYPAIVHLNCPEVRPVFVLNGGKWQKLPYHVVGMSDKDKPKKKVGSEYEKGTGIEKEGYSHDNHYEWR